MKTQNTKTIKTQNAIWVRTKPQPGRDHGNAVIHKPQITHIVQDRHIEGGLYDFYIHFTNGTPLLVDGAETKIEIDTIFNWINAPIEHLANDLQNAKLHIIELEQTITMLRSVNTSLAHQLKFADNETKYWHNDDTQ